MPAIYARPTLSGMPALDSLRERLAELSDLHALARLAAWDQRTMMPPLGAPARANPLAPPERLGPCPDAARAPRPRSRDGRRDRRLAGRARRRRRGARRRRARRRARRATRLGPRAPRAEGARGPARAGRRRGPGRVADRAGRERLRRVRPRAAAQRRTRAR